MNRQLLERNGMSARTSAGVPGRPRPARGSTVSGRALLVLFWFVVVSPLVTRSAALPAAEAAPNSSLFLAQAQPKKSARQLRLRGRDANSSGSSARAKPASRADSGDDAEDEDAATAESEKSPGFFRSLISGIREQAVWIVIALVCAIGGVLAWVLMGGRASSSAFDEELEDTGPAATPAGSGGQRSRYSTTKIQARDVNDRLALDSTEVETDREYALVVDEEALKKPEVDERTGQVYTDASEITKFLDERRFDEAYDTYTERLRGAEVVEFHSEVERTLSEHFLDSREFDKAARILEHHVATHAAADISPDTYFNLGYIHFFSQRAKKARRFLKLYVERENDPTRVERARRILDSLDEANAN